MIIHLACDLSRVGYHIIYINDIYSVSNLLKIVLFADDTNTFCSSTSLHDLQDTINRELAKLFLWFSVN